MEIYKPGEKVQISNGEIEGFIDCVALYAHGRVLYEIVWWSDGTRNSAWLNEQELDTKPVKIKVGFKTKGAQS